mgnify:CR=1 FL=1
MLDANTGQNALAQVAAFDAALDLTGLVLTKLDGTAKGGGGRRHRQDPARPDQADRRSEKESTTSAPFAPRSLSTPSSGNR